MKNLAVALMLGGLLVSCGGKEKKEEKEGFEVNRAKTEVKAEVQESAGVPIDMNNKGVGPIKELAFADEIDAELVAKGDKTFNSICIACHMIDKKMIGPALTGVYERRSPEWVMNMILNPDGMLKEDPIAIALLKEHNNAVMLNQNLSEEDARAVAEYLRGK